MICKHRKLHFPSYFNHCICEILNHWNIDNLSLTWYFLYKMYYNMIGINFNHYFIEDFKGYNLHGHTHHIRPKTRPHTKHYNFFVHKTYKI